MLRLRSVALLLVSVLALSACGDDDNPSGNDPLADLVGSWTTTSFEYTADADPTVTADIFALAGLGITNVTVGADGTFTGDLVLPSGGVDLLGEITNLTGSSLTLDFLGAAEVALGDTLDATYSLSGDVLTLNIEDVDFDFTLQGGQGVPASLQIVLTRA